jgi:hypothetical protein
MTKQNFSSLVVALVIALAFLVTPVAADTIAVHLGNSQSATVGTAVAIPPSVIVMNGTVPVVGASVIFAVTSGGGSITGASLITTDANGIATVGGWTLGSTVGSNTLTASSESLSGSPVTFTATGTSLAPTIDTVDPATGINNGLLSGVIITGTGYSSSSTVRLVKSGYSDITMANTVITTTTITGAFPLNGVAPGSWDVVLISNGGTVTKSPGFTVVNASSAATVTAISPTSATTNTSVSTTFTGTGFQSTARMRLARSGYNDIVGTVSSYASTSLAGTFDLSNQAPGSYTACVLYDGTNRVCGPTFTINAAASTANGSIYFTSAPSGSVVYVDSVKKGTTPFTLSAVVPGSYAIKIQRASYLDWADRVTVTAGNETVVSAKMTFRDSSTTEPTTAPIVITTATLPSKTVKSTLKTPTPWPSATPTPASPVDLLIIIGAVGLGIVVLRKQ